MDAIAVAGGRRARRAALRGVLATGAASGIARVARTRGSRPTTLAFASATAVSIEVPLAAVGLAAVAAAVGYWRVHHVGDSVGDVMLGAAIGVGAAVATTKVWPRVDASPASARPVSARLARVLGEPSADGAGLTIVVNPAARSGRGDDPVEELRAELPAAKIIALDDAGDLESALRDAAVDARAIGIVGGDGSINTAVAVALEHGCPLVVVPGGTLNHFARDVGIESVADAARAVRDGQLVEVDVGLIDGHPFVNTASFGSYSKLVEAREELEQTIGKWAALAVALVRVLWNEDPLEVTIDGHRRRIWMIFVGNCSYGPPGFAPATRARLDDGEFDVRIVDGSSPGARVRLITAALTGNLARSQVYTRRLVPSLTLRTPASKNLLAADGEVFDGGSEFTIEKHPRRLLIYTPE